MGLLDQVIGGLLGSENGGTNSAIGDALKELLAPGQQRPSDKQGETAATRDQGGLGGLLDSLSRAGHGDVANSWVGPGENQPVTPQQLEQALDSDTIDKLSRRTGLSREELLRVLSQKLPTAVDKLTPKGHRPSPKEMGHW